MRLETVAESWATYQAKVLPPKAGPIQIEETRRAFYAGVYFCLVNLAYNIGDDSTDEEQGVVELEKLKAECEAYAATTGQPLPHAEPPFEDREPRFTVPDPDGIARHLQALGHVIADDLPEGWVFCLLAATVGAGGSTFYVANADRADVIALLREFINRQTQ